MVAAAPSTPSASAQSSLALRNQEQLREVRGIYQLPRKKYLEDKLEETMKMFMEPLTIFLDDDDVEQWSSSQCWTDSQATSPDESGKAGKKPSDETDAREGRRERSW